MPSEYVPYGPEWEREMMMMSKKQLVNMLRHELTKPKKTEPPL